MKLSEAIRLGSMLKPQGRRHLCAFKKTCALGAALDAIGQLDAFRPEPSDAYSQLIEIWPVLSLSVSMPLNVPSWMQRGDDTLLKTIWLLNDSASWTREQIADLVASQEALAEPISAGAVREEMEIPVVSTRA